MFGVCSFRWLYRVPVSPKVSKACRENENKAHGFCKSLQQAVCLASSRGRGRQLPDVPSRGSPSTPVLRRLTQCWCWWRRVFDGTMWKLLPQLSQWTLIEVIVWDHSSVVELPNMLQV